MDDDFEHTELSGTQYLRQILEGLQFMHGQAVVHLDLKPENIVCVSPSSHWLKIIDFGLARKLGEKNGGSGEPGQGLSPSQGLIWLSTSARSLPASCLHLWDRQLYGTRSGRFLVTIRCSGETCMSPALLLIWRPPRPLCLWVPSTS